MRLTDVVIRQMPLLEKGQKRIRDDALPGFGVTVGAAKKTFFVMYGKKRKLKTLGHWPEISLKDARQAARLILAKPPVVRRSVSFKEARDEFLNDCRSRLRKSTADRYRFALKEISASSLDSVSLDITDATKLKSLKVFYNWCIDRGLTDKNPFARRKVTYGQRDRVLTDEEVMSIWAYEKKPYSDIVKMLLLTGQRRAQFANFQRDWIEDGTIVFPASVMKSGRQHIIPFLLEWEPYLPDQSSNSWSKNKRHMDEAVNVSGYVLHDFRRYFSTTCAKIGVPLHITEFILDHRTQVSGVAAIYNRYSFLNEMREALRHYEDWLSSTVLRQVKT